MNEQEWLVSDSPEEMYAYLGQIKADGLSILMPELVRQAPQPRPGRPCSNWTVLNKVQVPVRAFSTETKAVEKEYLACAIRDVFGNPFRPVTRMQVAIPRCKRCHMTPDEHKSKYCRVPDGCPDGKYRHRYESEIPWLTPDVKVLVAGMMTPKECPRCLNGKIAYGHVVEGSEFVGVPCNSCHGTGQVYDFSDMPILADALEDAGCRNEEVLNHCREEFHTPGCWVLRLLRPEPSNKPGDKLRMSIVHDPENFEPSEGFQAADQPNIVEADDD